MRLDHGQGLGKGEGWGDLREVVARRRLRKDVFNRLWGLADQWVGELVLLFSRLLGALVPALCSRAAGLPPAGRIVVPDLLLPLQPAPTGGRLHALAHTGGRPHALAATTGGRPHALAATGGGASSHCRSHTETSAPEHEVHPLVLDPVQQPARLPLLRECHEAEALPTLKDSSGRTY